MNCPDPDELELYALGRVADPDPEVLTHIAVCQKCIQEAHAMREFAEYIKAALKEHHSR